MRVLSHLQGIYGATSVVWRKLRTLCWALTSKANFNAFDVTFERHGRLAGDAPIARHTVVKHSHH